MTAKIDGTAGLLQQYDYQVLTTAFTYTFAAGTTVLVMNPAGTLATGTITMPAAPADGMTISFSSTQQITALTVSANTGQSIVGNPTTLNAGGGASFVYRLANTTWYAQSNTANTSTGVPVLLVYTSSSNYTKPGTVKAIKVTVVGGGGTGGPAGNLAGGAGGGGSGGAAIFIYPAPSLPASAVPYTVGAAGATSSFGVAPITVISATGGSTGATATSGLGGSGGAGSGGTLNIVGTTGSNSGPNSGNGGSSIYGGGALGAKDANGNAATGYGGGGSGGSSVTPGAKTGGAGAAGVITVEEFY